MLSISGVSERTPENYYFAGVPAETPAGEKRVY
jgi:hypothetical protein